MYHSLTLQINTFIYRQKLSEVHNSTGGAHTFQNVLTSGFRSVQQITH